MRKRITARLITGIALLGISHSAHAHHGRASYDATRVFTIMGTVSAFQFSNPHTQLFLDVKDGKGKIEKWVGEGTSPNMLVREGWDRKTIKPGDQITATGHPARDGSYNMRIEKIVLPNGRELTFEGPGGT
jgi:DNA/RNA endonuclease YhcR with UshA esterase domain